MYVGQWSDSDLGSFSDDLVGCDTTLSLGFVYNGSATDTDFRKFNLPPPSVGYGLVQGPLIDSPGDQGIFDLDIVLDAKNLGMTGFAPFTAGSQYSDPRGTYDNNAILWYKALRGFAPLYGPDVRYAHPPGVTPGPFPFAGDPVAGTGHIDGQGEEWSFVPGDRRLLIGTGPFQLAPGATQEVVVAFVAGLGADRTSSVSAMKLNSRIAQIFYDKLLSPVPGPASVDVSAFYESVGATRVFVSADIGEPVTSVTATLSDAAGITVGPFLLYDDGAHNDGTAGDGVYAEEVTITPQQGPLDVDITLETPSGTFEFHKSGRVTTAGPVEISALIVSSDNINSDGIINPGENVRITSSLVNGSAFDFSQVSVGLDYEGPIDFHDNADRFIANLNAGTTVVDNYDPMDPTTYTTIQVSQNAQDGDTIRVNIAIVDSLNSRWNQDLALVVKAFQNEPGHQIKFDHVSGRGDGDFSFRIVDANSATGHDYEIRIIEPFDENDVFGFDLMDLDESEALLSDHPLPPNTFEHTMPVTDGFKLFGENFVTELITFSSVEQIVDANPNDGDLSFWGDGTLFGYSTGLWNESGNGVATPSVDILRRDLEFHFTGLTAAGDDNNNAPITSGGQWATQWALDSFGESDLSGFAHQQARIPFELWDVENDRQVNVAFIVRNADGLAPFGDDPAPTPEEALWRIMGRDYIIPVMSDYPGDNVAQTTIVEHTDPNSTWILFFSQSGASVWSNGDVFKVEYPSPLTSEDIYRASVITDVEELAGNVNEFLLLQNYPNPFNPKTTIQFALPKTSEVTLKLYNVLGREVATLLDNELPPGDHKVVFEAKGLSSGVYFYRIQAESASTGSFTHVRKLLLLK